MPRPLVLASASPRRAKILKGLGIDFTILKTSAEEVSFDEDPERTVRENALAKGQSARLALGEKAASVDILSADTIVWFENKIYGKPADLDEARRFLRRLGGNTHTVYTCVALNGEAKIATSRVKFRPLDEAKIDEYVNRVRPLDRAGAYDIDESADLIVESFSGSYENIMGLPVEPLIEWNLAKRQAKKKVLLHSCCGPCAAGAVPRLKALGFDVALFFSNSNIDCREEFDRRLAQAEKLAAVEGIELVADRYDHEEWLRVVASGREGEPEKGSRCRECFKFNLAKTRDKAKALNADCFTTSLTISPHKSSKDIFAACDDPDFLKEDFKKQGGFLVSTRRAKELGLYRQAYCGCEFSKRNAPPKK